MTPFDDLQREHERLLDKADIADVVAYIDRARTLAAQIGDPRERDQLRANLRYWASYVYDRNGTYPTTTLLPSAMPTPVPEAAPEAAAESIGTSSALEPMVETVAPAPRKIWLWLIGAVVVVLLAMAAFLSQFSLMRFAPMTPSVSGTLPPSASPSDSQRLWSLAATTQLYDKPGDDMTAQVLGRMQAGSAFYAVASAPDGPWLKITTADGVSGWIAAQASGLQADQLKQLPMAAIVIVSTSTPIPTSTPAAIMIATAASMPIATALPPTPTPGPGVIIPTTGGGPLQVDYQIMTSGPSPFNAEAWVYDVRLLATGGDNTYVYWVNGRRLNGDRYTIDGTGCRAATFTIGATSGGEAVRLDVTLKPPLTSCQ